MLDIRHHTLAIGKGNSYQAFFDTEALELDVWLPLFHSTPRHHSFPPLKMIGYLHISEKHSRFFQCCGCGAKRCRTFIISSATRVCVVVD